jgi:TonB family protein
MPRVPSRWHSSYASVYAVVQVDGSLTDVQVQVSRADENFVRALKEAAAQWRFAPAKCDGKAVVSETQLEIHN